MPAVVICIYNSATGKTDTGGSWDKGRYKKTLKGQMLERGAMSRCVDGGRGPKPKGMTEAGRGGQG